MIEILETENLVRLNFLKTFLESQGLSPVIFDAGTPYRQFPGRLMVPSDEVDQARRLIKEAEADL